MTKVFVAGIGMTQMGKFLDRSIKQLTADAVAEALKDAGADKNESKSRLFF